MKGIWDLSTSLERCCKEQGCSIGVVPKGPIRATIIQYSIAIVARVDGGFLIWGLYLPSFGDLTTLWLIANIRREPKWVKVMKRVYFLLGNCQPMLAPDTCICMYKYRYMLIHLSLHESEQFKLYIPSLRGARSGQWRRLKRRWLDGTTSAGSPRPVVVLLKIEAEVAVA